MNIIHSVAKNEVHLVLSSTEAPPSIQMRAKLNEHEQTNRGHYQTEMKQKSSFNILKHNFRSLAIADLFHTAQQSFTFFFTFFLYICQNILKRSHRYTYFRNKKKGSE